MTTAHAPLPVSTSRSRPGLAVLVALGCVAPLLARALGPALATDDGFYVHGALMMSRGYAPYLDFVQVAFPLAEAFLALGFQLFGVSLRLVELANAAVILAVAAALYAAGRNLATRRVGALAALLWCWSLWVVHFNVFERETWAALGTAMALAVALRRSPWTTGRSLAVAAALALAFFVKVTAVMPALALCLHLACCGRPRRALELGLAYTALLALGTWSCWLVWGQPFLEQVFLFGFFRGQLEGSSVGHAMAYIDHSTLIAITGAVFWALPRWRLGAGAVLAVFAMDILYSVGISPTFWNHNMINLYVSGSLLGAAFLDRVLPTPKGQVEPSPSSAWLLAAMLFVGGLTAFIIQSPNPWMPGQFGELGPGAGGRDRSEFEQTVAFLTEHTGPDDVVLCAEDMAAVAADRVTFVRYFDLAPIAWGLHESLQADGLAATFAKRHDARILGAGRPELPPLLSKGLEAALITSYWKRLFANAQVYIRPQILDALDKREIALVVEPLNVLRLAEADLTQRGYERVTRGTLAGWRPAEGPRSGTVRRLWHARPGDNSESGGPGS